MTTPAHPPGPPPALGTIIGPSRFGDPRSQEVRCFLDLLDLDAAGVDGADPEPARIPLDFFAHGFALHPHRRHQAALLEKRGPGACYVDLLEKRVLATIAPMQGHHFYGHGAFSKNGDVLFAVETDLASKDGVISVRDPASFAVLGTFPTYGLAPHDCHLIEDGNTLAITNGGGVLGTDTPGSVTFVDVASQKLLERHAIPNERFNAGHVAMGAARAFAVVSAPRDGLPGDTGLGGVSLRSRDKAVRSVGDPAAVTRRMTGEALSVCLHEGTQVALATHPYGHLVSYWNLATGSLIAVLDMPHPRGVTLTLDGRWFVLSFAAAAGLLLVVEASTLRPLTGRAPGTRRFGGSHIYTWQPPS